MGRKSRQYLGEIGELLNVPHSRNEDTLFGAIKHEIRELQERFEVVTETLSQMQEMDQLQRTCPTASTSDDDGTQGIPIALYRVRVQFGADLPQFIVKQNNQFRLVEGIFTKMTLREALAALQELYARLETAEIVCEPLD
jgi:hypothetical protein